MFIYLSIYLLIELNVYLIFLSRMTKTKQRKRRGHLVKTRGGHFMRHKNPYEVRPQHRRRHKGSSAVPVGPLVRFYLLLGSFIRARAPILVGAQPTCQRPIGIKRICILFKGWEWKVSLHYLKQDIPKFENSQSGKPCPLLKADMPPLLVELASSEGRNTQLDSCILNCLVPGCVGQ